MIGCVLDSSHGRTGNQLWRAASTIGLALDRGCEPAFENDWLYRRFFSLPDEWFHPREFVESLPFQAKDLPEVAHIPEGYRVYMQDVGLWWHHRNLIRSWFQPSPYSRGEINAVAIPLAGMAEPSLAMHVRRGDNVTNDAGTINCLPADYYHDGYQFAFHDRLSVGENPFGSVLIVTDDSDWCRDMFVPRYLPSKIDARILRGVPRAKEQDPAYLTESPLDWLDLFVLAGCTDVLPRAKQMVMSNSSFAYWAAMIGGFPNPIRPSYWCGEQLTVDRGIDVSLLWPETWTNVVDVDDPAPGRADD